VDATKLALKLHHIDRSPKDLAVGFSDRSDTTAPESFHSKRCLRVFSSKPRPFGLHLFNTVLD